MAERSETAGAGRAAAAHKDVVVSVRDLQSYYDVRGSFVDRLLGRQGGFVKAVDGVSFDLAKGEVLGLVGESGSGKTTLGRSLLGLTPITGGSIEFDGVDLTEMSERQLRSYRRKMQTIFQDPHASLNPAMTIGQAVGHPLVIHRVGGDRDDQRRRVADALERVGLAPVEQFVDKYPADLSGGQKQRAVIARAIILAPALIVADEPISMLDMSVRAKILELLLSLKQDLDLTYLYITHDLATAKYFCDRIAIMYLGKIVEIGPSESIYAEPRHPYTRALLRAIPEPDPERVVPRDLPRGEVPDAVNPPLGCTFHPRCPHAFELCGWESRDLRDLLEARWATLGGEGREAEQAALGDLAALDEPLATVARLRGSAQGRTPRDVLRAMREADPDEPLWKGVHEIEGEREVTIHFNEPVEPLLLAEDQVEVSCHLYDAGVRERSRQAAERRGPL